MTTIACDGKSMAADGMINMGGMITDYAQPKVVRLEDGRLVGWCGTVSDGPVFAAWLESPESERPKLDEGFAALVLSPDGSLRCYEDTCNYLSLPTPSAIGTGGPYAVAAMDIGETAEQAVARAAYRDLCTGGTIIVLHLET